GRRGAAAAEGGTRRYRVGDWKLLEVLRGHDDVVFSLAWRPDGKQLASGSFDGLVRLWDEKSGRLLATLLALPAEKDHADWLALTPEGYATGSPGLAALARWRMAGREVAAGPVWQALRQPDLVARALRGETVPAPKFGK